ncbi:prefoldin subunit [Coprinellus micaceus]|uniref:Prefoldin subunit 3 n=1 Tax=Coprinellus micaceus TaxID=71717 RepID=A0A4Y7SP98_COPMI|nr:prefoldin subunit [Coprinellus micaceus]
MSKVKAIFSEERNPRGIPKAPFIANVDEYMAGSESDVESTLRAFQDAIAKYRYMEANLTQKRASLEEKIPDIRKTLDVVEYLQERREGKSKSSDDNDEDDLDDPEEEDSSSPQPITTTYELNDTLYAEAQLEESDSVYLWLGANVMLSYKLPEALSLLNTRLDSAEQNLNHTIEDLEFLREQLTIMEVNTARVYNWDVKQRREKRVAEESGMD